VTVEIALAALVSDGKLLLGHRHPARRWYPDCWDLIGGHIEVRETPEQAVRRECREEIAVDVSQLQPVDVALSDPDLVAYAFLVTGWVGQPINAAPDEHDALQWFAARDLPGLRLADPGYYDWLPTLINAGPLRALG
jgi:8-oxo-dGTP diphosphatase